MPPCRFKARVNLSRASRMLFEFTSTERCRFWWRRHFLILAVMVVPGEGDSVETLEELEVRWREDLFGQGMAVPWWVGRLEYMYIVYMYIYTLPTLQYILVTLLIVNCFINRPGNMVSPKPQVRLSFLLIAYSSFPSLLWSPLNVLKHTRAAVRLQFARGAVEGEKMLKFILIHFEGPIPVPTADPSHSIPPPRWCACYRLLRPRCCQPVRRRYRRPP